jgi:hypothetical protein
VARPKPPADKPSSLLLAEAIGKLAQEGDHEGRLVELRAAQVLEAVVAALSLPSEQAAKALERAAATIHAALETKPTITDPEHKGPVAEQIRENLVAMFSDFPLGKQRKAYLLDPCDATTMASVLDVTARMVVGADRIFQHGTHEERVERWTKALTDLYSTARFKDLKSRCTAVIQACARADGYDRPANLFRSG